MCDIEDADSQFVAQFFEEVDDRHAQRRVDHRDWLVGDNQLGVGQQRASDRDALQLSAGKFAGVLAGQVFVGEPDCVQLGVDPTHGFGGRGGQLVIAEGFKKIAFDRAQRVEGAKRVLKDRLDSFGEPDPLVFGLFLAAVGDGAGGSVFEAQNDAGGGGFAAAALAGQGKNFGRFDKKRDIVDCGDAQLGEHTAQRKDFGQIFDFKQLVHALPLPPANRPLCGSFRSG